MGLLSAAAGAGDDPDVPVVQFCWPACGAGVVAGGEGQEVAVKGGSLSGCECGVDRGDRPEGLLVVLAVPGRPARYRFPG